MPPISALFNFFRKQNFSLHLGANLSRIALWGDVIICFCHKCLTILWLTPVLHVWRLPKVLLESVFFSLLQSPPIHVSRLLLDSSSVRYSPNFHICFKVSNPIVKPPHYKNTYKFISTLCNFTVFSWNLRWKVGKMYALSFIQLSQPTHYLSNTHLPRVQ